MTNILETGDTYNRELALRQVRYEMWQEYIKRLYVTHAQCQTHETGIEVVLKILEKEFDGVYEFGQPALDWIKKFRDEEEEDEE